jgi:hypothetical protein
MLFPGGRDPAVGALDVGDTERVDLTDELEGVARRQDSDHAADALYAGIAWIYPAATTATGGRAAAGRLAITNAASGKSMPSGLARRPT